ncbi:kinetochore protein NDC80 homolog [Patiria miniata]|uniref:Kinetochore protein NDC80 n=1 Tax=Patiria miniata TaxID=46514 RepID=A0A914BQ28_PATMI|nr:kinetochore protein NDC80 homolog [Patiria miniata]XP_038077786.1 kinetochore protein NDC80 homolog [Patiria miniata]
MYRPSQSSSSSSSRRSSVNSGRASLAPLRVKQDNAGRSNNAGSSKRLSSDSGAGSSRSSTGNRKSVSQKHGFINTKRQSSGYGGRNFGHEIMKDTRPLSDKSYMQREIRDIVDFLTQHGYPHPLNNKMLMTPTTKDFLKIFQFLYNFLEVKYAPAQKFEEEIPQIFKTLKYPFNISKSSMFTVGSPHTWPNILGALHWLLNSVRYALGVDEQSVLFSAQLTDDQGDEFDSGTDSEVLFNYVEGAYKEFLDGADTFEEREEALAQGIKQRSLGQTGNLEQLAAEEQRLAAELQLLQQEPCRLTALQEHAQMMAGDNERFYKYLQELNEHKRIHQQKLQDIELQFQQAELELEQTMNEQQRFEHQLANQELSASDVQRLHSEMRQLNATLEAIERDKQEIDQEIWDKEKQIAKKQEQLEKHVTQFNSQARSLNLIPSTAENAHGIDYEMKINFYNAHGNKASLMDFTSTIKPALIQMKKQVNEEVHKLNSQKLLEEETLEQLTEMVESKQDEVSKLDTRLQRRAKELETLKEKIKEESRQLAEQQSLLEQKIQQQQVVGDTDQNRAQAELKELITRYHEHVAEMQQEYKDYEQFLLHACTKVLEHKAIIDERISELDQQASAMIQRVRNIDLPPPAPSK